VTAAPDPGGARKEARGARALGAACRASALFGGAVLLAVCAVTLASVGGRALFGTPVLGDFELVEMGCAVAVFAFLPWCQWRGGNPAVHLFTDRAPRRLRRVLEAAGHGALALVAALIGWRLVLGGVELRQYGELTMVLRLPLWWGYVPAAAALGLLALAGAHAAWRSLIERDAGE